MTLLVADGVTKTFAGITALDDIHLDVGPEEIVGLIGPNGAGKTTFFNCLLGILKPDGGRITFQGRDLARVAPYKRARLGIGRTFQRIELFSGMTPRDHFLVAERSRNGRGALWKDVLFMGGPSADENVRVGVASGNRDLVAGRHPIAVRDADASLGRARDRDGVGKRDAGEQ